MKIGNREFQTKGHTYVMGILNVTPDSFSDGGKWNDRERALKHVEEMIAEGMDIVDIGGESTRLGYTLLSDEEEIARVVPMIEAVKANFDIPISGVGFGKTYENNLEIINCLEELNMFGYPLLLGCSRKSVIGLTLDLPVTERVEGTLVTTMFGVQKGCMFVRVHDVKENVRTIKMCEAILNSGK